MPDDDPVVTKVRKTAVLHSGVVDNRDHRTVGDSASKEYTFYDKGFADKLRKERYGEKLADLFTKNHLVTRQTSIAWYKSTFPADMRTAKVEMDTTIEFVAADPGYLEASKFALDTPYTQHRTLSLARSGDTWTIVAIQKGPLTPQEQAPLKPGS
ncbi:hypothetical protein ABZT27_37440 [Streptomyces sp. NPDC005389]|uniref:hypothetical protein n=1 Tax=Streptomyces sp. NPDC005389 TaxID=3157040 RepID=UPI0033A5DB80